MYIVSILLFNHSIGSVEVKYANAQLNILNAHRTYFFFYK